MLSLIFLSCPFNFIYQFNSNCKNRVSKSHPNKKQSTQTSASTANPLSSQSTPITLLDEETSSAFQKIATRQNKYAELNNPTMGKYRSFSRELDEFPSIHSDYVKSKSNDGTTSTTTPTVAEDKSYKRQDNHHSAITQNTKSVHTAADAHFAKALRMLSSPFDKLENGGNALPPKLYTGNYRQDVRGEKFVRMNWLERRWKRRVTPSSSSNNNGENHRKNALPSVLHYGYLPDWYLRTIDRIENWYHDAVANLYDVLGVEFDGIEESSSGNTNSEQGESIPNNRGRNEEDLFSWSDTRVGSQLIRMYEKIVGLWTRHPRSEYSTNEGGSTTNNNNDEIMSTEDHMAMEGLYHLEKAAELGHAEAQRMVANSLASGILPLSDHSLIQRYAKWKHIHSGQKQSNSTALLANSALLVPDDFSSGGEQLSRAIVLWHMSAMDGNVESAMALGFRHLYSATGGTTRPADTSDEHISPGYSATNGGATDIHGTTASSHYGVLGTCPTAMAYYEAAANGVMDELESGPTKGKVPPPLDEHRLAQIHMRGGASVALEQHNKPDEIEEALQYYRMLASRNRSPEPDLTAAFTIANFYHLGLRGVKQDLRLALKYYEICGDYNHWEGGGLAGLFHVWGIGMRPEERDLGKALSYFQQGTPGGIEGCLNRMKQKKKAKDKDEEVHDCDRHSANGMGLISLLGIDGLVDRSVANARKWFEIAKELGDSDGQFNYAMLRLGWMVTETYGGASVVSVEPNAPYFDHGNPANTPQQLNYLVYRRHKSTPDDTSGPSVSDFNIAIAELSRAASKGHIQAKHKLAMLYATGAEVHKKNGKPTIALKQSCMQALQYYKSIADSGHTVSMRNRAAWKQYNNGDIESALRNYLAAAEAGSVAGQMNAAFLLEQGYCLGMATDACTRASIRLWRVAARQGSLEACLRVGDFYYYGRMKKQSPVLLGDADADQLHEPTAAHQKIYDGKALYFAPGPYRWARYLLYPEEALSIVTSWLSHTLQTLPNRIAAKSAPSQKEAAEEQPTDSTCSPEDDFSGTCSEAIDDSQGDGDSISEEDREHMAIAAQYYRKAAEDHKSARANFNLGFMYEWGLGLHQDFPLAKRHYDLAREEADLAASLALFAMGIHEKALKGWMYFSAKYLSSSK